MLVGLPFCRLFSLGILPDVDCSLHPSEQMKPEVLGLQGPYQYLRYCDIHLRVSKDWHPGATTAVSMGVVSWILCLREFSPLDILVYQNLGTRRARILMHVVRLYQLRVLRCLVWIADLYCLQFVGGDSDHCPTVFTEPWEQQIAIQLINPSRRHCHLGWDRGWSRHAVVSAPDNRNRAFAQTLALYSVWEIAQILLARLWICNHKIFSP